MVWETQAVNYLTWAEGSQGELTGYTIQSGVRPSVRLNVRESVNSIKH